MNTLNYDNKKIFIIFRCNIRSINAHFEELLLFFKNYEISKNLVIILAET